MAAPLLEVAGLTVALDAGRAPVELVTGVSFTLAERRTTCLVGESGCGKSLTALAIAGLLAPPLRIASGAVRFAGRDLVKASAEELREVRGAHLGMVFQDPQTALNPVLTLGEQLTEGPRAHLGMDRAGARAHALGLLGQVGLGAAEARLGQFPHQLSGGMRQRVMLAVALASGPELLIADEPTSALDLPLQAQLLALLSSLQRERGMALLLITHDLAVVERCADEVLVMYAGRVVEAGPAGEVLSSPRHPYTRALRASMPSRQPAGRGPDGRRLRLAAIPGAVPSPRDWPSGCRFRDRCPRAAAICAERVPEPSGGPHRVACHFPEEAS